MPTTFTRTRFLQTEQNYLKRALWFESFTCNFLNKLEVSPMDMANVAIEKKSTWSSSTWRQIKASLVFRFQSMNSSEAQEAALKLVNETQNGTLKDSFKTSAQRKKNSIESDVTVIAQRIKDSRSKYAPHLLNWIILGGLMGLRPHEWTQSDILWASDFEINNEGDRSNSKPYLRVLNAKNSNFRSHGKYRHLSLGELDQNTLNKIAEFIVLMNSIQATGEYQSFYEGCSKLLLRINSKFKREGEKHVQIYSARHQFASMAKNTFSKAEVAALMGHANDLTADGHYGKKNSKTGLVALAPIQSEVSKIKKKNNGIPESIKSNRKSKIILLTKASKIIG